MNNADKIILSETILTCNGNSPKLGDNLRDVSIIKNAAIAIKDSLIAAVDNKDKILSTYHSDEIIDFKNNVVMPGFVDPHTHPIFFGSRVNEFLMRAKGSTYEEIFAGGGGILNTVKTTKQASDDILIKKTLFVFNEMLRHGTTSCEAKSGYGLTLEQELRQLYLLNDISAYHPIDIAITFLCAHAIPPEYAEKRNDYVDLIVNKMIPTVKEKKLAKFIDVFCEEGAFNIFETERILRLGSEIDFKLKIHAEEFKHLGGCALAARMNAVSADHLLVINDEDIKELANSKTVAVLLPGTSFFLNKGYANARKLIDGGAAVAIATDFNAGSCQTFSMQMIISLACIKLKMTPEEAINAATINAACAINVDDKCGSLDSGKYADFIVLEIEDYRELPYLFGTNIVKQVYKKGNLVVDNKGIIDSCMHEGKTELVKNKV